eukprot:CAMPEP_0113836674 /NCGR_PEP_ID=MMETSP0328-20130328/9597_1 /TAXON_ID=39455 /ORGANISM="Alexandrium minutum" /LENGTH=51 /DNA_ID=CAMNT_0000805087 /DNA_START=9 /DNA_END=160 /DNA_ORIENTATION=- /assembly_acc=CAM_ASM_000350
MPVICDGSATGEAALGQASISKSGWVTCDASAQGGPKFFEPWQDEQEQPAA